MTQNPRPRRIVLPQAVARLYEAHCALQAHFASTGLPFTLDGRLVGDLGEALAAEAFGLKLCRTRIPGVDAHASDGRTVQVKATGKAKSGPAFTPGEGVAQHLVFLRIDFAEGVAEVGYNGPEAPVRALLPAQWKGTKVVPLARVLALDGERKDGERLAWADPAPALRLA